jgi:TAT-translocated FGD2 family F420-dependent dehydrogenase
MSDLSVISQQNTAVPARETKRPTGAATLLSGGPLVGFMLAHEQFGAAELITLAETAARSGFDLLATSDHFQPWQANEGHSGLAWVTMGAMANRIGEAWMGTTVTCPTLRYHPSIVAEAFATLSHLHPGRVFLGVGSGEALNERAAMGLWPAWEERWERLIEALQIIRALWEGEPVAHRGRHYTVSGRLYDPPTQPIPILTAANGKKSMRLAGRHGDGLITDPLTWRQHKSEWEAGAREAGKDPAEMPVLVEQFVVVGDEDEARRPAALWRFLPKAFKAYYEITHPAAIERRADAELPIEEVIAGWTVSPRPDEHIAAIDELFKSGATIVNIHSGQTDQQKVIDFYGSSVLPEVSGRPRGREAR